MLPNESDTTIGGLANNRCGLNHQIRMGEEIERPLGTEKTQSSLPNF